MTKEKSEYLKNEFIGSEIEIKDDEVVMFMQFQGKRKAKNIKMRMTHDSFGDFSEYMSGMAKGMEIVDRMAEAMDAALGGKTSLEDRDSAEDGEYIIKR